MWSSFQQQSQFHAWDTQDSQLLCQPAMLAISTMLKRSAQEIEATNQMNTHRVSQLLLPPPFASTWSDWLAHGLECLFKHDLIGWCLRCHMKSWALFNFCYTQRKLHNAIWCNGTIMQFGDAWNHPHSKIDWAAFLLSPASHMKKNHLCMHLLHFSELLFAKENSSVRYSFSHQYKIRLLIINANAHCCCWWLVTDNKITLDTFYNIRLVILINLFLSCLPSNLTL